MESYDEELLGFRPGVWMDGWMGPIWEDASIPQKFLQRVDRGKILLVLVLLHKTTCILCS